MKTKLSMAATVLALGILILANAGCGGGSETSDVEPATVEKQQVHAIPSATAPPVAMVPLQSQTPSNFTDIAFPRHDAPLGTDRGEEYFAGKLVVSKGCLRAEAPSYDAANPQSSWLIIWPAAFTLEAESGSVRIVDGLGRTAAQVGDHVRLSRADVTYHEAMEQGLVEDLAEDCAEPYLMVGDEVTVFDPRNEATELRLSDPDVLFLRQKTVMGFPSLPEAAGFGELVLDGQCLRLDGSTTIVWPAGFTPHVHQGVVQVRNGAGTVIATVGDEIAAAGGYSSLDDGVCSGESVRSQPNQGPAGRGGLLSQAGWDPDDGTGDRALLGRAVPGRKMSEDR